MYSVVVFLIGADTHSSILVIVRGLISASYKPMTMTYQQVLMCVEAKNMLLLLRCVKASTTTNIFLLEARRRRRYAYRLVRFLQKQLMHGCPWLFSTLLHMVVLKKTGK